MTTKQKVLASHFVPKWLPLTQTWLYNQIKYLPSDIESHIFCEKTSNLEHFPIKNLCSFENANIWQKKYDYAQLRLGFRRHLGFLANAVKRCKPQILHTHFGEFGWKNQAVATEAGIKYVVTFYGHDVNRLPTVDPSWNSKYRSLFDTADLILCEGPHMARCIASLGCPKEKIKVHHLGIEVDKIHVTPRQWRHGEKLRVLIASGFREKKGIPFALKALAQLQKSIALEVTVIGDATPTTSRSVDEKTKILKTVEDYKLTSKVRFMGFQPHDVLFKEAYQHHIFLSPSITAADGDTEGGAPISIIEMAATGMPVVSTFHCDIPEVIQHGKTGLLADEKDVEGLVRQISWLVNHSEKWSNLASEARRHIEAEYSAIIQGENLARIYRELINDENTL